MYDGQTTLENAHIYNYYSYMTIIIIYYYYVLLNNIIYIVILRYSFFFLLGSQLLNDIFRAQMLYIFIFRNVIVGDD